MAPGTRPSGTRGRTPARPSLFRQLVIMAVDVDHRKNAYDNL
ncbi:hypothetical protein [Methanoculleus sp.]|nr:MULTISPECIES: hypothetical protein [Methanoculleus]